MSAASVDYTSPGRCSVRVTARDRPDSWTVHQVPELSIGCVRIRWLSLEAFVSLVPLSLLVNAPVTLNLAVLAACALARHGLCGGVRLVPSSAESRARLAASNARHLQGSVSGSRSGAVPRDVVAWCRDTASALGSGIAAVLTIAALATGTVLPFLFETQPASPLTFAAVAAAVALRISGGVAAGSTRPRGWIRLRL